MHLGYGGIWTDNGEERGTESWTVHGSAQGGSYHLGWQYLPGLDGAVGFLVGANITFQWTDGSFYHSYRYQGIGVSFNGTQHLRSTELQIPLMCSLRVHRRWRLNAGVTLNVLLRQEHHEEGVFTQTYFDHVETSEISGSYNFGEPHGASTRMALALGTTYWVSHAAYLDLRGSWSPGHRESTTGYNPCNSTLVQFSLGLDPWAIWSKASRSASAGTK